MELPGSAIRYHYMDNLRALAMMLGVFFHAALAYSPFMKELWLSADDGNLLTLDCIAWYTHLFRMPLFFLIAGFFAHYLVRKRGIKGFLKNRVQRIALPFVVFLPITIVALLGVVYYASFYLGIHTVLLDFVVEVVQNWPSGQAHFSTSHLWFLYCLLWFCGVAALCYRYLPWSLSESRLFRSPAFVLGVLPFMLVPSLLTQMTPFPAPESLIPEVWGFGFFGVFFLLGWVFYLNESWLAFFERFWFPMGIVCVLAYSVYYPRIPREIELQQVLLLVREARPFELEELAGAIAAAFVSLYSVFICLLLGSKFLTQENQYLRYIADSSYWVYIIHLPLMLFIQMHLIHLNWPLTIKYGVGVSGTIFVGVLSYAFLVRGKPIGRMLNGR